MHFCPFSFNEILERLNILIIILYSSDRGLKQMDSLMFQINPYISFIVRQILGGMVG